MDRAEEVAMSVCAGCGEPFVCGASAGLARCWCMDKPVLALDAETGAEAHCYCTRCLERKISGESFPAA